MKFTLTDLPCDRGTRYATTSRQARLAARIWCTQLTPRGHSTAYTRARLSWNTWHPTLSTNIEKHANGGGLKAFRLFNLRGWIAQTSLRLSLWPIFDNAFTRSTEDYYCGFPPTLPGPLQGQYVGSCIHNSNTCNWCGYLPQFATTASAVLLLIETHALSDTKNFCHTLESLEQPCP